MIFGDFQDDCQIKFWNWGQRKQSHRRAINKCNYPSLRLNQIDLSELPTLLGASGTCKTSRRDQWKHFNRSDIDSGKVNCSTLEGSNSNDISATCLSFERVFDQSEVKIKTIEESQMSSKHSNKLLAYDVGCPENWNKYPNAKSFVQVVEHAL